MQKQGFQPSSPEHQCQNWVTKPPSLLSSLSGHNTQLKLIPRSGHSWVPSRSPCEQVSHSHLQLSLKFGEWYFTPWPRTPYESGQWFWPRALPPAEVSLGVGVGASMPSLPPCLGPSTDGSPVPGKWQHRWAVQLGSGPNTDVLIKQRTRFQEKSRKRLARNLCAGTDPVSHWQGELQPNHQNKNNTFQKL